MGQESKNQFTTGIKIVQTYIKNQVKELVLVTVPENLLKLLSESTWGIGPVILSDFYHECLPVTVDSRRHFLVTMYLLTELLTLTQSK